MAACDWSLDLQQHDRLLTSDSLSIETGDTMSHVRTLAEVQLSASCKARGYLDTFWPFTLIKHADGRTEPRAQQSKLCWTTSLRSLKSRLGLSNAEERIPRIRDRSSSTWQRGVGLQLMHLPEPRPLIQQTGVTGLSEVRRRSSSRALVKENPPIQNPMAFCNKAVAEALALSRACKPEKNRAWMSRWQL